MLKKAMSITESGFPNTYKANYAYGPQQFLLLRFYDVFKEDSYILVPTIIKSVCDDNINGYICKVNVWNMWKDKSISGSIEMDIVVHKYHYLEDSITEEYYNIIPKLVDKPKYIFFIEKIENEYVKVYPFREE